MISRQIILGLKKASEIRCTDDQIAQFVWSGVSENRVIYGNFTRTLRELYENFTGTLRELYGNFTRTLRELYENFTGTLRELYENFTGTLRELYGNFTRTLRELYETYGRAREAKEMASYLNIVRRHIVAIFLPSNYGTGTSIEAQSAVRCAKTDKLRNEMTVITVCFVALYVFSRWWLSNIHLK